MALVVVAIIVTISSSMSSHTHNINVVTVATSEEDILQQIYGGDNSTLNAHCQRYSKQRHA